MNGKYTKVMIDSILASMMIDKGGFYSRLSCSKDGEWDEFEVFQAVAEESMANCFRQRNWKLDASEWYSIRITHTYARSPVVTDRYLVLPSDTRRNVEAVALAFIWENFFEIEKYVQTTDGISEVELLVLLETYFEANPWQGMPIRGSSLLGCLGQSEADLVIDLYHLRDFERPTGEVDSKRISQSLEQHKDFFRKLWKSGA